MAMIDERRRKIAHDRKKELDEIRKKRGRVRVIKLVYKKEK